METQIYNIEEKEKTTVLTLKLDSATIFQREQLTKPFARLLEEGKKNIVLDLSHTTYISSMILASFVSMQKKAQVEGGNFVISGVKESVREILATTKLDNLFQLFDDTQKAIDQFSQ
jgi:anti-sigma B factor antagonist